jgi:hypothetical protein
VVVKAEASEEGFVSISRVETISELVTANFVPSQLILSTLIMEAIRSSETSALTKSARRHIKEDGILQSLRGVNLKSHIALTGWPP